MFHCTVSDVESISWLHTAVHCIEQHVILMYLRMTSKECWNSEGHMFTSFTKIWACSRVTAMAVLSLALLQLVTRPPSTVRHT